MSLALVDRRVLAIRGWGGVRERSSWMGIPGSGHRQRLEVQQYEASEGVWVSPQVLLLPPESSPTLSK